MSHRAPRPVWQPPVAPDTASLYARNRRRKRFFNPWSPMPNHAPALVRWQLSANPYREMRRRRPDVPRAENDGAYLRDPTAPASVTWIGHSTALVHDAGDVWLTDPVFSRRLFVIPRHHPPALEIADLPAPRFVVVSHDHYDHLDLPTIDRLPTETVIAAPLGIAGKLERRGREVVGLDWWTSATLGDWKLTLLPAQHWCRRGLTQNDVLWGSWLVEGPERSYYFGGDTGYFHGFKEFGKRFAPIDVALLPIGAYEPRWFMRYQHMDPTDALDAFEDLGARHLVPVHWGTFDLTDEPIDEAPRQLARELGERNGLAERVHLLPIGGRFLVPDRRKEDR